MDNKDINEYGEYVINNDKPTTYLIGPIEDTKAQDCGKSWRSYLKPKLEEIGIHVFDPISLEKDKTGMETATTNEKLVGWKRSGNWEKFMSAMNNIWEGYLFTDNNGRLKNCLGDIGYVNHSDFLIAHIEKGDKPCVVDNTKVLMADFSQKYIKDLKKGDKIIGFKRKFNTTTMVETKVLDVIKKGYKQVGKLEDEKGNKLTVTPEHKILTSHKRKGSIYKNANKIDNCYSFYMPSAHNKKYFYQGWLAGYFQNDGCVTENCHAHRIDAVSDRKEEIYKVKEILDLVNVNSHIRSFKTKEYDTTYYKISIGKIPDFYKVFDWIRNHRPSKAFKRGWLTGAIDADGDICKWSIKYYQSEPNKDNIKIFKDYLKSFDIPFNIDSRLRKNQHIQDREINSSKSYRIMIPKRYAFLLPSQLQYKRKKLKLSINENKNAVQYNLLKTKRKVYDITTTTGNFVANGFIIHNCGTFFEMALSYQQGKPIYLVTDMNKTDLSSSLLWIIMASKGEIFRSYKQLIDHLKENEL